MTPQVKMALIIAGGIVGATGLYLYFSPFQQCVRATSAHYAEISEDLRGPFLRFSVPEIQTDPYQGSIVG